MGRRDLETEMRICAAQTRPVKGDIAANIRNHTKLIELAASGGADVTVFPELSLTGYEPKLAKELAIDWGDDRLGDFQNISDVRRITIGVGAPMKSGTDICIGMIVFRPHGPREAYLKRYLHSDEEPFFVGGRSDPGLMDEEEKIALAICYELSVPEHAKKAFDNGAKIYLASVAKTAVGVEEAGRRLSDIAGKYSMMALMANCVGECDGVVCAGGTAIWNDEGSLIGRLDDTCEGLLILDTDTCKVVGMERRGLADRAV